MKRVFFVIFSIVVLFMFSIVAQAQLFVGGGAKVRNEIPYFTMLLAVNNNIAELAWGTQNLRLNKPGFQLQTDTNIFSPLIKVFLALDGPISPYLSLGGVSLITEAVGNFKGKPVHVLIKRDGAQGGLGVSYQDANYPIVLSADVNYSTIEANVPLNFIIDDNIETLIVPFPGISGWGWSISARTTFNLESGIDDLFEWIRNGFGLGNEEETS